MKFNLNALLRSLSMKRSFSTRGAFSRLIENETADAVA